MHYWQLAFITTCSHPLSISYKCIFLFFIFWYILNAHVLRNHDRLWLRNILFLDSFLFFGIVLDIVFTRLILSTGTSLQHFPVHYLLHIPSFWWVWILVEWLIFKTFTLLPVGLLPERCIPDECITNQVITENVILSVFVQSCSLASPLF